MFKKITVGWYQRQRRADLIGFWFAFVWFVVWYYCFATSPLTPNLETNEIYEINNHGTVHYLNLTKNILLYAIPSAAILYGAVSHLFVKYDNKPPYASK